MSLILMGVRFFRSESASNKALTSLSMMGCVTHQGSKDAAALFSYRREDGIATQNDGTKRHAGLLDLGLTKHERRVGCCRRCETMIVEGGR